MLNRKAITKKWRKEERRIWGWEIDEGKEEGIIGNRKWNEEEKEWKQTGRSDF